MSSALTADITLPEKLSRSFVWRRKMAALHDGS